MTKTTLQPVPKPSNEMQRLSTLTHLDLLNDKHHERFDHITRVISALFDTPFAMVNLITADEQITKACYGLKPGLHMDRDVSFCAHAILLDEPLIIEDTLKDDRFKNNPNVTGGLKIRSYAGVALRAADGTHPGTLCVADTKPRKFTKEEINLLKDLSNWAEIELNSSQLRDALEQSYMASRESELRLKESQILNKIMAEREVRIIEISSDVQRLNEKLQELKKLS